MTHKDMPMTADRSAKRASLMLGALVTLVIGALLVVWAANVLSDPDIWWHIRLGADVWANRALPVTDTYSHTFYGQPFIAKEWLSQIIWFFAYSAGGWGGVLLLTIASVCTAAFMMFREFARHLRPVIAASLMLVFFFLTSPIFNSRPHILTLPIIVLWSVSLFRAADCKTAPPMWLLPLMVLWANLHAGFTVGFMIAGFAAVHAIQEAGLGDRALLLKWAAFLVLCPAAALVHPYLYQPLVINFTMVAGNEAVPYISEWQPFSAWNNRVHEIALILAFLALLLSRLRLGIGKAGLLAFSLHMFLSHIRFVYALFLVCPLAISRAMALAFPLAAYERWKAEPRDPVEKALASHAGKATIAIGALVLLTASFILTLANVRPRNFKSIEDAIGFAQTQHLNGNVLNSYEFGGPLIFHGIKTFIDSRADQIFLNGFITSVAESRRIGNEKLLEGQLEKYGIGWTMLAAEDPRIVMLDRTPGWKRVYQSENVIIHARSGPP